MRIGLVVPVDAPLPVVPQAAVLRPYPQRSVPVLVEGQDVGIGQVTTGLHEPVGLAVVEEEARACRADPEHAFPILVDGRDRLGNFGVVDKVAGVLVIAVQPADGSHPQRAGRVHHQRLDGVVDERPGVGAQVAEDGEGVAVVAVEAVLGAEPEKALGVLDDGADDVVREAVFRREVEETGAGRLSVCRRRLPDHEGQYHRQVDGAGHPYRLPSDANRDHRCPLSGIWNMRCERDVRRKT